jgi:hypothetical protein
MLWRWCSWFLLWLDAALAAAFTGRSEQRRRFAQFLKKFFTGPFGVAQGPVTTASPLGNGAVRRGACLKSAKTIDAVVGKTAMRIVYA